MIGIANKATISPEAKTLPVPVPEAPCSAEDDIGCQRDQQRAGDAAGGSLGALGERAGLAQFDREPPNEDARRGQLDDAIEPEGQQGEATASTPAPIATTPSITIHATVIHSRWKADPMSTRRSGVAKGEAASPKRSFNLVCLVLVAITASPTFAEDVAPPKGKKTPTHAKHANSTAPAASQFGGLQDIKFSNPYALPVGGGPGRRRRLRAGGERRTERTGQRRVARGEMARDQFGTRRARTARATRSRPGSSSGSSRPRRVTNRCQSSPETPP